MKMLQQILLFKAKCESLKTIYASEIIALRNAKKRGQSGLFAKSSITLGMFKNFSKYSFILALCKTVSLEAAVITLIEIIFGRKNDNYFSNRSREHFQLWPVYSLHSRYRDQSTEKQPLPHD